MIRTELDTLALAYIPHTQRPAQTLKQYSPAHRYQPCPSHLAKMSETGQRPTMNSRPTMIDMDSTRSIDIESLKLQYSEQFASYTPRDRKPSITAEPNPQSTLPDGRPRKYKLEIYPPLLNSSSPWATTVEDIQALYDCEYTGAVTTRTSLLEGFNHDPAVHQHVFFPAGRSMPPPSHYQTPRTRRL